MGGSDDRIAVGSLWFSCLIAQLSLIYNQPIKTNLIFLMQLY
jgi:hypothetical protein